MKKLLLGIAFLSLFGITNTFAETINFNECNIIAPDSCFKVKTNGVGQSFDSSQSHCTDNGKKIKITDTKIVNFLKNDGKTGYSTNTNTSVSSLQSFLQNHTHTTVAISNNKYCNKNSFNDGKYGNCTKEVFQEYLNKTCLEEIKELETDEEEELINISGKVLNKKAGKPIENITISIGNNVMQTNSSGEFALEVPFAELTKKVTLLAQDYNSLYETFNLEKLFQNDTVIPNIILQQKSDNDSEKSNKLPESTKVDQAAECLVGNEEKLKTSTGEERYPDALKKYQTWRANSKNVSFCECEKIGKERNEIGGCFGGQIFKWQEDQLRPKFQTGANWQDRKYTGDAGDITYWLQKFGGRITGLLSTIAVLIIAYNGFLITAAGSDDDTLSKAKDAIKWALIGLIGLNFVYIIVKTVISLPY